VGWGGAGLHPPHPIQLPSASILEALHERERQGVPQALREREAHRNEKSIRDHLACATVVAGGSHSLVLPLLVPQLTYTFEVRI
jgi:hypothetical protein